MVAGGGFRSDLYYRLNVFPITLPALRERVEDIPSLVRHFTQKFARRMNRRIETIPAEAMAALCRYAWPGNVRELENAIERAVILTSGRALSVPVAEFRARTPPPCGDGTLEATEREAILRTLRATNWVLGGPNGAAARLGLKRTTLQSRMGKLGIRRAAACAGADISAPAEMSACEPRRSRRPTPPNRGTGLASPFRMPSTETEASEADGIVLAPQLAEVPVGGSRIQPEKRLQLAVLEDAIRVFLRCAGATRPRTRRLFAEVDAWFGSDATDSPFAFESICDTLGLDPSYVRRGVQRSRTAEGTTRRIANGSRCQVLLYGTVLERSA
jgi:hypothetical protein